MGFLTATLKLTELGDNLIYRGSLFQSAGAETENERRPYVAKQNLLGCSRKAEDERRFLTGA